MDSKEIFDKVISLKNSYDLINRKNGKLFNIFDVTGISTNEVRICRVLHEMISPYGRHGQNTVYLKMFIKKVLKIDDIDEEELKTAKAYKEYVIKDERRIDLVIETVKRFIPIEVKIYAEDQPNQCFDYYDTAKKINMNKGNYVETILYYLTTTGYEPSEYSAKGLTKVEEGYSEVRQISFKTDILNWLEECAIHAEENKLELIHGVILQLISTAKDFTNQMEDEMGAEINTIIMESPENMRNAISITNSVNVAKEELLMKLFKTIEAKIQLRDNTLSKINSEYDYAYDNYNRIRNYYNYQKSTMPSISYICKRGNNDELNICVGLELDWRLYGGYYKANDSGKPIGSWLSWEYCTVDGYEDAPNFKSLNDGWYALFDEFTFEKYTDDCADFIIRYLAQKI